jgi:hypothetical protein
MFFMPIIYLRGAIFVFVVLVNVFYKDFNYMNGNLFIYSLLTKPHMAQVMHTVYKYDIQMYSI